MARSTTNRLECTNGSTEECFIIQVIAVFSRFTFGSGGDWNHHWLSYLGRKFFSGLRYSWAQQMLLTPAILRFWSPEHNDLPFSAQINVEELPLRSDFYKRHQKRSSRIRISISTKIQIRFLVCSFLNKSCFLVLWQGGRENNTCKMFLLRLKGNYFWIPIFLIKSVTDLDLIST